MSRLRDKALVLLWGAALLGAPSCGGETADPRPQWIVTVATDAPIPQLFDRLLIDVLDENGGHACVVGGAFVEGGLACRRIFGVGKEELWPLSFGVAAPPDNRPIRIRARLFRADTTGPDGLPQGDTLIDVTGRFPSPVGPTPVFVELRMDCFGVPPDLSGRRSCDGSTRTLVEEPVLAATPPTLPRPNTWPPSIPVDCGSDVPAGMICHRGGVFVMGRINALDFVQGFGSEPEHLVRLSPFALDANEITVGEVATLIREGRVHSRPLNKNPSPNEAEHACTFLGQDDRTNDALPVNCVSHETATEVCAAMGKRLPTEAEWEYAAGNLTDKTDFPWGSDPDACSRAIVGRGRTDVVGDFLEDASCRGTTMSWGPVAGGHPEDITRRGVRNMAGNLAEWVQDQPSTYTSPCWERGNELLLTDPVCNQTDIPPDLQQGIGVPHVSRGGDWTRQPAFSRTYSRTLGYAFLLPTGFRCAK